MPRPIEAVIDRGALRHNLAVLRKKAGGRFLWAVSKANSYGHGLAQLLSSLEQADGLAVLDIDEAERARKGGWKKPVFLIEGFFDDSDLEIVEALGLDILVHSPWQIESLKKFPPRRKIRVYIKINSGMNRLGFQPSDAGLTVSLLSSINNLEVSGLLTHFANAELGYPPDGICAVGEQLERFKEMENLPSCLANSAAILWHPEIGGNAVRAGIALYGVSPSADISSEELDLIPVMTLKTRILSIQELNPGEAVGYGSRHIARERERIAVIACGYADGYPRQKNENRHVLIRGCKAPIVGNISMDMTTVNIDGIPGAREGDEVELWGRRLPVNEVASLHDTIGYELLANLNERVPRTYIN